MIQNIILIILIIILIFFVSNNKKINELISKKYIKYLFILLIIYFIYKNYNLTILCIFLLIILFLNMDFQEKIINNKYLKNLGVDYLKESFLNNNEKIEPFKTEVLKLKDLYENIKLQINKLK
jgi:hypothetical protein